MIRKTSLVRKSSLLRKDSLIGKCRIYRKSMGLSFWMPLLCLLVVCPLILLALQSESDLQRRMWWEEYFLNFTQIALPFFYALWLVSGQKSRFQGDEAEVLAAAGHGKRNLERRIFLILYIVLCTLVYGFGHIFINGAIRFFLPCLVAVVFMHCSCFLILHLLFAAMPVYLYAFLLCFVVQTSVNGFPSWYVHPQDDPLRHSLKFLPFLLISILALLFIKYNDSFNKQRQFSSRGK